MTISLLIMIVQQREIVQTMCKLNKQINKTSFICKKFKLQNLHLIKNVFWKCRITTAYLCATISAYSKQWSPFMSTVVPIQVFGVSYLSYFIFFSRGFLVQKHTFIFFVCAVLVILFVETNLCAQIVRYNSALIKESTMLVWKLGQLKVLSPIEKLKCQRTTEPRQFAFKFIDGNSINSETFPLVSDLIKIMFFRFLFFYF